MSDRLNVPMNAEVVTGEEAELIAQKYISEDEEVMAVLKGGRDYIVLTDIRLIHIDIKSFGDKEKVVSFPWDGVVSWNYETKGKLDANCSYELHYINGEEFIFGTKDISEEIVEILNMLLV